MKAPLSTEADPGIEPARFNLLLSGAFAALLGAESYARFHGLAPPNPVLNFAAEHGNIAAALVSGRGFADPFGTPSGPTCWVPPLFPCYLAAFFLVLGTKTAAALHAVLLADVVLAGLSLFAALGVLDELGRPRWKPALALVLLGACALHQSALGLWFSTSWMVGLECSTCLWLALRVRSRGRTADWLGLGLAAGAALLTHAGTGFAACLCLLLLALRRGARSPAAALAAVALCILPVSAWTLRNHREFGAWVPLKPTAGFETYLALAYTGDGVIDDAVMMAHHPYCQADLLRAYTSRGERDFLEPYAGLTRAALEREPWRWTRGLLGRAVSILEFCDTASSVRGAGGAYSPRDEAALVESGLAGRAGPGPRLYWTSLKLPRQEARQRILGLGLADPSAAFNDWLGSQAAYCSTSTDPIHLASGLVLAAVPTLCFLLTALLAQDRRLLLPSAFYMLVLAPNLLITYDSAHALLFLPLQSVVVTLGAASAIEAFLGRLGHRISLF